MEQLGNPAVVVDKGGQPAADTDVALHPWVFRVLGVHVVAFFVRHHFEGQLVVVAKEYPPAGPLRYLGRPGEDFGDGKTLFPADCHEHPGHQRKMEAHVAFVAVAEVLHDVFGPLVGLCQQYLPGVERIHFFAQPFQVLVGLREIFTVRAFGLEEIRHRVQPETVQADVEPITQHIDDRVGHFGVLEVEVGLVREKAVPVVLAPLGVPCPIGFFGVDENYPGIAIAMVVVAPYVPVGLGVGAVLTGLLEPCVLVARVVDDQVGDHPDTAPVGLIDELGHVGNLAVVGQHRPVIGYVVAAVAQW